ncbi:MAG: M48 family metallopeptidase [candidate division Zixibacteria bacterium]|nr:M48 family metallopeptidase [candidate division Zixibacteria bacterium]
MKRWFCLFVFLFSSTFACAQTLPGYNPTETATPGDSARQLGGPVAAPTTATLTDTVDSVYPITPERRALVNQYSTLRLVWEVIVEVFDWIVMLVVAFTGLSALLLKLASRVTRRRAVHFVVYLFLFFLLIGIISFPITYYQNYVIEHQFGFSNQTFGQWFGDQLKEFPVMLFFMTIMFGFFYFLIRRYPRRWWLWFSAGAVPFVVAVLVIVPVVVSPMFNDFQPLKDKQLETQILNLASKAGIEGSRVFEVDASRQSTHLNAYVTGLFGTKRIVLYDTIIKAFSTDELLFVMGHEMGHYVKHHIWIIVGMIVVLILISTWLMALILPKVITRHGRRLGFAEMGSYASLPLVLLAFGLVMFVVQPATNCLSRYFEDRCDIYSMEITGYNNTAATVAFEKLAAYNLSDPNPSRLVEIWFYDHPALQKRIDRVNSLIEQ